MWDNDVFVFPEMGSPKGQKIGKEKGGKIPLKRNFRWKQLKSV